MASVTRPPWSFGPSTVPLAWRNLVANKSRLVRSSAGIGFAVLLMLVQLGFERGFFESSLQTIERLDGDLFVLSTTKYRFSTNAPFPRRFLYTALAIPGVASARPLYGDWQRFSWKSPTEDAVYLVQALAFDPDQPVLQMPEVDAQRDALKVPDTVVVDRRSRRFLGMDGNATRTVLNGSEIRIAGSFALGPDFQNDGTVVMSDRTFAKLVPGHQGSTAPLPEIEIGVIKTTAHTDPAGVQQALRAVMPPGITVMTKAELLELERNFEANVSSAGPIFLMGTVVGFVVGMLIAYQIIFTDLMDQLPQYATLKAMGYGTGYLIGVVLQQAALSAAAGYVPAWLLCLLVYWGIGAIALIPLHMTLALTAISFALTLGMCLISGAIAVRRVIAADPAEVF